MKYIEDLYRKMMETLQENKDGEALICAESGCEITERFLTHLNDYLAAHPFTERKEEIRFFKEQKPLFLKEHLYYAELFRIESNRPIGSKQKEKAYLELNLEFILLFFDRNRSLYNYYRTGKTALDHRFFVKEASEPPVQPDYGIDVDPNFSNVSSYNLGKMLAYESLKHYLEQAQLELEGTLPSNAEPAVRQKWLGSKAELIELCYALQSRGVFGGASVKAVVHYMEVCFEIKLGNFYRVFQEHRIRKKSRTLFLDALKESLIRRMDESDLDPHF